MQVLEDDQRPTVLDAHGYGVDRHGASVDQIGGGVAEHRADEVERPAERARFGLGDQHRRPIGDRVDELSEEARLADARFPGDEGDGGEIVVAFAGRSIHQLTETTERRRPPDHDRADATTTYEHVVESTDQRRWSAESAGG